jgi:hypothetical protein
MSWPICLTAGYSSSAVTPATTSRMPTASRATAQPRRSPRPSSQTIVGSAAIARNSARNTDVATPRRLYSSSANATTPITTAVTFAQ